ncbi:MAG: hypothetical protein HQL53_07290 [Magnetococcales bacterium]|nr:hypothetical protein [Magnetococcales bacterium]
MMGGSSLTRHQVVDADRAVLLVGVSPSEHQLMAFALEEAGYLVERALHEADALARLREMSVELIFYAPRTPRDKGGRFLRILQSIPALKSIPIVLVGDEMERSDWSASGVAGWVQRPISPIKLLEMTQLLGMFSGFSPAIASRPNDGSQTVVQPWHLQGDCRFRN